MTSEERPRADGLSDSPSATDDTPLTDSAKAAINLVVAAARNLTADRPQSQRRRKPPQVTETDNLVDFLAEVLGLQTREAVALKGALLVERGLKSLLQVRLGLVSGSHLPKMLLGSLIHLALAGDEYATLRRPVLALAAIRNSYAHEWNPDTDVEAERFITEAGLESKGGQAIQRQFALATVIVVLAIQLQVNRLRIAAGVDR